MIHHYKTTTYYFRINELIKRINKKIKEYLKKYINYEQND